MMLTTHSSIVAARSALGMLVLLLLVGQAAPVRAEAIAVVASPKFAVSALSEDDVRQLYLGKVRELSGVGSVVAVDLPTGHSLHDEFAEKVLDKTPKELNAYWSVRIFSGRGTPPMTVSDPKELKAWLGSHPDAIGYIDARSVDSTVKVLLKVP